MHQLPEGGLEEQDPAAWVKADRGQEPDRMLERRRILQAVQEALAGLAKNRRTAVELYLQGLTTQEIAVLVGWSEAKARNLVYRGLTDLRERLRAAGIEYDS